MNCQQYQEELQKADPILQRGILQMRSALEAEAINPIVMCEAFAISGFCLLGATTRACGCSETEQQELQDLLIAKCRCIFDQAVANFGRLAYQEQLRETLH